MESFPTVSVVVSVYNTESYLDQCIQSLLSQTYHNLEIILVDDGSTDRCAAICDGYAKKDSRVIVIHKENEGPSFAREAGIRIASGSYLMIVDSDDWIDPETIESCIDVALRDRSDCVLYSYIREYGAFQRPTYLFDKSFSYDVTLSEEQVYRRIIGLQREQLKEPHKIDNLSSLWTKLYSINAARRGRIVSDRITGTSEDTIFNLYALQGCKISYIHKCFYHYRKSNANSITTHYKQDLPDKWDVLYSFFDEYIEASGKEEIYRPLFLNRVACGMIGLGLNEACSPQNIFSKAKKLKSILNKPLYIQAFCQLDTSFCPVTWRVFFWLCKRRAAFPLAIVLDIINFLRSHSLV